MKKASLLLVLSFALAACSHDEPMPSPLELNYGQQGKMSVDVRDITFIDRSMPAAQPTDVSNLFRPTIGEAINRWASDRLQAMGTTGQAAVIVRDASVTSHGLPLRDGMDYWFKRQQAAKYAAHVAVEIEAHKPDGTNAYATAEASHEVSLPENPSGAEKEKAYQALLQGLMHDLTQNLEQSIHEHMQAFIAAQ